MNKHFKALISILLLLSVINILPACASEITPYADSEFDSAYINIYDTKKISFTCSLYNTASSISVTACWLQKKVDGNWTSAGSLTAPSKTASNTHGYAALEDYSGSIGVGTYRVGATFNADGHTITRYSSERTFN